MGFGLSHTWHKNTPPPPKRSEKVVRATQLPSNQCCGCGKKRWLSNYGGVKHCSDRACFNRAKKIAMGEA